MHPVAAVLCAAMLVTLAIAVDWQSFDPYADAEEIDGQSFQTSVSPVGSGDIEFGEYDGKTIILTAVSTENYEFREWLKDGVFLHSTKSIEVDASESVLYTAVFSSLNPVSDERTMIYKWNCPVFSSNGDVTYSEKVFTMSINSDEYNRSIENSMMQRRALIGATMPTSLINPECPYVQQIAHYLSVICDGMTDTQTAYVILRFVQDSIDYRYDTVNYGTDEFWTSPMETLYKGTGDCEDTSILFCSIASAMGKYSALVAFQTETSGHMGAAIVVPSEAVPDGASFDYDGMHFVFCETTADDILMIGLISETYKTLMESSEKAIIAPIEVVV